jgi:hypothetical protein
MKRFLMTCTLAVALLGMTEEKASAWSKFGFSVGMNVAREKANDSFLWGAFKYGPAPYECGPGGCCANGAHGGNANPALAPALGVVPAPAPAPVPAPSGAYAPQYRPAIQPVSYYTPVSYYQYPRPAYYWPGR